MELEILASKLQLDVGYEIPSQKGQPQEQCMAQEEPLVSQEEQILTIQISGLPPGMDNPNFLKMSIEHYLIKLNIKFKSCEIVGNVAYVTLEDPSSKLKEYQYTCTAQYMYS
jgi:hypothetical protein